MQMTITHHQTRETITLSRDVRTTHPAWVHEQMGTESEPELQATLDQYSDDAAGLGADADGVAVLPTANGPHSHTPFRRDAVRFPL